VNHEIGKRAVAALLAAVESSAGTVLVCRSHKLIANILHGLAGELPDLPYNWPQNRFDLVWVLDRAGSGWSFYQVGQLLLPGDALPSHRRIEHPASDAKRARSYSQAKAGNPRFSYPPT
jgi:hypothetical protein